MTRKEDGEEGGPSVGDLRAARWRSGTGAQGLPPDDALYAALRDFDSGDMQVLHVTVCVAEQCEDGTVSTHVYSAGAYTTHGAVGLVHGSAHTILHGQK